MTHTFPEPEPYYENISLPDLRIPVRILLRDSAASPVFAHPHWHDMMELLYFQKGTAMQQVNLSHFKAGEGDLVIIGSGNIHSTYTEPDQSCRILVVQFDRSIADGLADLAASADRIFDGIEYPLPLSGDSLPGQELRDCLLRLFAAYESKGPGRDLLVQGRALEAAGLLERHFGHLSVSRSNLKMRDKARSLLANTFELVESHYPDPLRLVDAASASSFSIPHFCRLFRQAAGMSFADYLTVFRLKKALSLIGQGQPLTRAALDSGFGSMATFNRAFRLHLHKSPSEYLAHVDL